VLILSLCDKISESRKISLRSIKTMSTTLSPVVSAQLALECGIGIFGECRPFGGIPGVTATIDDGLLANPLQRVAVNIFNPATPGDPLIDPTNMCLPITCWTGCNIDAQTEFNPSTGIFQPSTEGRYEITATISLCPITLTNLVLAGLITPALAASLASFPLLTFLIILFILLSALAIPGAICPSVSIVRSIGTSGCVDELARVNVPITELAACGTSITLKACPCLTPNDKVFLVVNNNLPIPIFLRTRFTQLCIEQVSSENCLCPIAPR
jgi:hypothetical protein